MLEVAAALIRSENRFLICKRPAEKTNGGLWEFPGGKLEEGETAAMAAVRECMEELSIQLEASPIPVADVIREDSQPAIHLMLCECRIIGGSIRLLEHSDARMINPEEIPNFSFCPADRRLLKILYPNI